MLLKTQGIVLSALKYRESSLIVKVYTEKLGLISCIINGVRNKSGKKSKVALYQPLTLLDLVIYHKNTQGLKRIAEAGVHYPFKSIPFEFLKSTIAIFLTEFLEKCLKEEEGDIQVYEFVRDSICIFDEQKEKYANFHLIFLLRLTEYLGFGVHSSKEFLEQINIPDFDADSILFLSQLLKAEYSDFIACNGRIRNHVLNWIIQFYQFQIEGFGTIKSLEILKELQS